ncbi:MAG: hypothetical protein WBG71_04355 [Leeuwenhoekiella sp.]
MQHSENQAAGTDMSYRNINTRPSSRQLTAIYNYINATFPDLTRLQVKPYYRRGRVIVRATLGKRKIHVRTHHTMAIYEVAQQYKARRKTAFFPTALPALIPQPLFNHLEFEI